MEAKATLANAPRSAIALEDQDGNTVALWHPDMKAFDELPRSIREFMADMCNPPCASNVLASVRTYGATVTLCTLREIDFEDKMKARPQ